MAIGTKMSGLRLEPEMTMISRESNWSDDDDDVGSGSGGDEGKGSMDMNDSDSLVASGGGLVEVEVEEVGGVMEEVCQYWNYKCSLPLELYDLESLKDVLSVDTWNDVLTDEDRFKLTEFLPDLDEKEVMRSVRDLLKGEVIDFESPMDRMLAMLKGGMCEPKVAQNQQGLKVLQKREHYHKLRKYHNNIISSVVQIKGLLENYGIEERVNVLNATRGQKSLMQQKLGKLVLRTGSGVKEEANDDSRKIRSNIVSRPMSDHGSGAPPNLRGFVKLASSTKELGTRVSPAQRGLMGKKTTFDAKLALLQQRAAAYDPVSANKTRGQLREIDAFESPVYDRKNLTDEGSYSKQGSKRKYFNSEVDVPIGSVTGMPFMKSDSVYPHSKNRNNMNLIPDVTNRVNGRNSLSYHPHSQDGELRGKYHEKLQRTPVESHPQLKGVKIDWADGIPFRHNKAPQETFSADRSTDRDVRNKKMMIGSKNNMVYSPKSDPYYTFPSPMDDPFFTSPDYRSRSSLLETERKIKQNGGSRGMRQQTPSEETESDDSSEDVGEEYGFHSEYGYPNDVSKGSDSGYNKSIADQKRRVVIDRNMYTPKQKASLYDTTDLHNYPTGVPIVSSLPGSVKLAGDAKKQNYNIGKGNYFPERKWKTKVEPNDFVPRSSYIGGEDGNFHSTDTKLGLKVQNFQRPGNHISLLGCDIVTKKRKAKLEMGYVAELDNLHSGPQPMDETLFLKKRFKRKPEAEVVLLEPVQQVVVVEPEPKPVKPPFVLITPTVHSGFSFSIVHLLSAVRLALIADTDINPSDKMDKVEQKSLPSITVQEIVNRVRSNPGDPSILETQEPLQDLIRGVLKIFSSKTAPLGAKAWKPLVVYEKSTKCWTWIGPIVSPTSTDPEYVEEVTSPEAWGLTHKVLVKLVDSFANWLKIGQVTLQQIGTLPPPPLALMQPNQDEKERFKDLRAQKSLATIAPSCEEVRAYFRQEEILRYSIPDRAFSYTAADGKKSIVAPLRRCGGKPTSKARDHFMLKPDRPPHITILCLVRDAASRLPGGIGTRADVCTLIRDSQYIVENITDAQVNQAVSGALDRLHYERDPCVQFDGDRKLWVYLHRDREEEDFDDDGTASTKKWKRQKKDPDPAEQSVVAEEQTGVVSGVGGDLSCDLNVDPSSELIYSDLRPNIGEGATPFLGSVHGGLQQNQPGNWNMIGLNPLRETNNIISQKNTANDDLLHDGDAFSRGRQIGVSNGNFL